ncbi:MAG: MgtC/SapB family protein [Saprospirales bacterium]|nr:MgtC/SapB family protein [Saprospirales bacterium]MBK8493164.1 MgtC/SapB family protein [Saprospirales bacterium]
MPISEFLLRLFVALIAGFLIGLERQWAHKSAGLRTNTLVAVGAAIFVLLSLEMTEGGKGDATRIVGQVVTGIGFLGAGVILHQGISVHGLTTAATIWCSSAVGCLAAAGFLEEALIATGAVLVINAGLRPLDELLEKRNREKRDI